jgi:hypothetical protein
MNSPFQFQKCCQFSISAYNETLSIAMRVNSPDYSPMNIEG